MADRISIEVRCFAGAAAIVGARSVKLSVAAGCEMSTIRSTIIDKFPDIRALAEVSRWAVDNRFVPESYAVEPGTIVAMIPPVSGG